jgi:hypothetical protein
VDFYLIIFKKSVFNKVVQDWSVGEIRFGRKVSYPDKTIRTETALIYDAVQLFGKALTDLDRSQVSIVLVRLG